VYDLIPLIDSDALSPLGRLLMATVTVPLSGIVLPSRIVQGFTAARGPPHDSQDYRKTIKSSY